jgi:hypothetical protein
VILCVRADLVLKTGMWMGMSHLRNKNKVRVRDGKMIKGRKNKVGIFAWIEMYGTKRWKYSSPEMPWSELNRKKGTQAEKFNKMQIITLVSRLKRCHNWI